MKPYLFLLAFIGIAHFGISQITLDQNNVPHSSSYSDVRAMNTSGIAKPAHGANLLYDYSSLAKTTIDTIPFMPATRAGFTGFTRFNYGSTGLSTFQLFSEYYTHKTNDGVFATGSFKLPQNLTIGTITGTATDSLIFPGSSSLFAQNAYDIKFPATYGNTWTANYKFTTEFLLTVDGLGLNNVPGEHIQHISQVDSVVGWGQLKLPTAGGVSILYDVLLVKDARTIIDSVYLGGNPAPAQLLFAFGLTQGQTSSNNEYHFYAANFERPLLEIGMSSNWQVADHSFHAATGLATIGVYEFGATVMNKVYPIPAVRGVSLLFEATPNSESAMLSVYAADGKMVAHEKVWSTSANEYSWKIPETMSAGIFTYMLTPVSGPVVNGKLILE